jgi:DNA ligase 1
MPKRTHIAEIIFRLSKTTSKKEKVEIAKKIKGDTIAEEVVYHALNPYWTYGVQPKKMREIKDLKAAKHIDVALQTQWLGFRETLNKLMSRELTGNAARAAVEYGNAAQWIICRILKKDLRCGAHISTFNEAMGTHWIPTFDVALADEGFVIIDGKIVQSVDIEYPIWAEPKYDGIRTIALFDTDDGVKLFSRKGKEFENFPHIKDAIERSYNGFGNMMLDGEVFGQTFDDVTTVAHTKSGKDDKDLMYRVWDCMLVNEFTEGSCEKELWKRQQMLAGAIADMHPDVVGRVQQAPGCIINNEKQLLQVFKDVRADGYEGLILKPLDGMYAYKRSRDWIKVKEMFTDEFKVVGFNKGTGKYSKCLGALVIRVGEVNVEVGSGFTDKQRVGIWKERKVFLGAMCEVKYQEKTKDGSLRFPTFLRWRPDKDDDPVPF